MKGKIEQTLALFFGWNDYYAAILVEITASYDLDTGSRDAIGYRLHDLTLGKSLEVETIGTLPGWRDDLEEPPPFVCSQFPRFNWRRLR